MQLHSTSQMSHIGITLLQMGSSNFNRDRLKHYKSILVLMLKLLNISWIHHVHQNNK